MANEFSLKFSGSNLADSLDFSKSSYDKPSLQCYQNDGINRTDHEDNKR